MSIKHNSVEKIGIIRLQWGLMWCWGSGYRSR